MVLPSKLRCERRFHSDMKAWWARVYSLAVSSYLDKRVAHLERVVPRQAGQDAKLEQEAAGTSQTWLSATRLVKAYELTSLGTLSTLDAVPQVDPSEW